jgi:hypothetical protein
MATSDEDTLAHHLDRMLADSEADTIRQRADDRAWAATATWEDVDALARKLVAANEAADAGVAGSWKESVRYGQRLAAVHERERREHPRRTAWRQVAAARTGKRVWPIEAVKNWTIRIIAEVARDLDRLREVDRSALFLTWPDAMAARSFDSDSDWAVGEVLDEMRHAFTSEAQGGLGIKAHKQGVRRHDASGHVNVCSNVPAPTIRRALIAFAGVEDDKSTGTRPRVGDTLVDLWVALGIMPEPVDHAARAIAEDAHVMAEDASAKAEATRIEADGSRARAEAAAREAATTSGTKAAARAVVKADIAQGEAEATAAVHGAAHVAALEAARLAAEAAARAKADDDSARAKAGLVAEQYLYNVAKGETPRKVTKATVKQRQRHVKMALDRWFASQIFRRD